MGTEQTELPTNTMFQYGRVLCCFSSEETKVEMEILFSDTGGHTGQAVGASIPELQDSGSQRQAQDFWTAGH